MTWLRRAAPLLVVLLLLGLAAVFALLAADVRAWQGTLRRDDVRFDANHPVQGLWGSPGDPAGRSRLPAPRPRRRDLVPAHPAELLVQLSSASPTSRPRT